MTASSSGTDAGNALSSAGLSYGLAAFAFWGLVPVYFKALGTVPALEVVAHRVVWSVVVLAVLVVVRRQGSAVRAALSDPKILGLLLTTTTLIATNWYLFIWAVAHDRIVQASLGYFINPLVNVALGVAFLREPLSRAATIAVALAGAGVAYQAWLGGELPWISLAFAGSFGAYGLLRKTASVGPVVGLAVETALLAPVAVGYLAWLGSTGRLRFAGGGWPLDLLLVAAGVITVAPLLWFTQAARLLPLSVMGFLQYLSPTMQLLLAVAAFGEPFTAHHIVTFGCIWAGLALFTFDRLRRAPRV